jgi:hypothetical protein
MVETDYFFEIKLMVDEITRSFYCGVDFADEDEVEENQNLYG